jgi:hypothetical protein
MNIIVAAQFSGKLTIRLEIILTVGFLRDFFLFFFFCKSLLQNHFIFEFGTDYVYECIRTLTLHLFFITF